MNQFVRLDELFDIENDDSILDDSDSILRGRSFDTMGEEIFFENNKDSFLLESNSIDEEAECLDFEIFEEISFLGYDEYLYNGRGRR